MQDVQKKKIEENEWTNKRKEENNAAIAEQYAHFLVGIISTNRMQILMSIDKSTLTDW